MTLICCTRITFRERPAILLLVDSMLSAGHRWPAGPKLFPITGRQDCAIAFEGDTELAYPLLSNALNFIRYSDHLNQTATDAGSVAMRMTSDINAAYAGLLEDPLFRHGDLKCSFAFVGWARTREPFAWHIQANDDGRWSSRDLADPTNGDARWRDDGVWFIGNGDNDPVTVAWSAWEHGDASDPLRAYRAFLSVLDDTNETAVGGMPQIAWITSSGCEVIGVQEGKKRYLLGHRVTTGATGVRYLQRDLSDLCADAGGEL